MEKIGRNEPCVCGSGRKYKKCCLAKDQDRTARQREESQAASRALDWLASAYPGAIRESVKTRYYGGLKKAEREALDELPSEMLELLNVNIGEWLLTDAQIAVDGESRPVRQMLLGPNGVPLTSSGHRWLASLGASPMGLYEVMEVRPGEGLVIADLLDSQVAPVWVSDRIASKSMVCWDIFGARLVNEGENRILSGALYPFKRETACKLKVKLSRKLKDIPCDSLEYRDTLCSVISTEWLKTLCVDSKSADDSAETLFLDVQTWPEAELASLGGRSPLKAVKTEAGRRTVVEIIKHYENHLAHTARIAGENPSDSSFLWDAVGLSRS